MAKKKKSKARANPPKQASRDTGSGTKGSRSKSHKKGAKSVRKNLDDSCRGHRGVRNSGPRNEPKNRVPQNNMSGKWDLVHSRDRLKKASLHKDVTKRTLNEIEHAWKGFHLKNLAHRRPTREEYLSGSHGFNQANYTYSKRLVDILLDPDSAFSPSASNGNLATFLAYAPWGEGMAAEMAALLAESGFTTLQNLAIADPKSWALAANDMAIFDFNVSDFRGQPRGNVFIAVTPEITNRDFQRAREDYDSGTWAHRDEYREGQVMKFIRLVYEGHGVLEEPETNQRWSLCVSLFTERLLRSIQHLPNLDEDMLTHRVDVHPATLPWNMLNKQAIHRLEPLLRGIYNRKEHMKVLLFQKVPSLDRRLIAIILRACPKVQMLGVYDCPLVHFGDVITLLDLIHEINQDREKKGLPTISSLDFYPAYNYGMAYQHANAASYGLTWQPIPRDTAQKGVFKVLLEACLKARAMGIKLLLDEGKGFRTFLDRLPLPPYSVVTFLDGLYRFLDLAGQKKLRREAMDRAKYDFLLPVRAGLVNLDKDERAEYPYSWMKGLYFCNSCGQEMPESFFPAYANIPPPHARTCAGCKLRAYLDQEDAQDRVKQRLELSMLLNQFNERVFNDDAPMSREGRDLLRLHTRESKRPPPPPPQMNAQGHLYQPQYEHAFVRDSKEIGDSLQGLPSLREVILNPLRWFECAWRAMDDDMYRTLSRAHHDYFPGGIGRVKQYADVPYGHRVIDHVDDRQPSVHELERTRDGHLVQPLDVEFALSVHRELENRANKTHRKLGPQDAGFW